MKKKLANVYIPVMTVPQLLQLCTEEEREQIEHIVQKYSFKQEA